MVGSYVPLILRERVIQRANGCCEYCFSPAQYSPEVFEVEHIIPVSAGGQTTLDNLALACPACNRYKGKRQLVTDPVSGHLVSLYNPRLQLWRDHFRWSEDMEGIIGITPTGRGTVDMLRMNRPSVKHFRSSLRTLGIHPVRGNRSA